MPCVKCPAKFINGSAVEDRGAKICYYLFTNSAVTKCMDSKPLAVPQWAMGGVAIQ